MESYPNIMKWYNQFNTSAQFKVITMYLNVQTFITKVAHCNLMKSDCYCPVLIITQRNSDVSMGYVKLDRD